MDSYASNSNSFEDNWTGVRLSPTPQDEPHRAPSESAASSDNSNPLEPTLPVWYRLPEGPLSMSTTPTPQSSQSTSPPTNSADHAARLRSCAACRIRRVKCTRDPGSTDCQGCQLKGLACTPMPVVARKPPSRSGKRIEQARALFGADQTAESMSLVKQKRARSDEAGTRSIELQESSVVGRLITTELEGALSSSLLDLYFLLPHSRIPMLEGTGFKQAFEASGRRMSQMDESSEALFSVILALASRVSDHPLLVGAGAPSVRALAIAVREGRDLSEFGKRRESACKAMADRAVRLADERSIWRKPSTANIASLLLLEGLFDQDPDEVAGLHSTTRPYGDAYMSHLRALLDGDMDEQAKARLIDSGIGWTAYMRDATISAVSGRTSSFSDDDVQLLTDDPPPSLAFAISMAKLDTLQMQPPHLRVFPCRGRSEAELDTCDPMNARKKPFWTLFGSFMTHLALIARSCPAGLTGRRARNRPYLDEPFAAHLLAEIDVAATGSKLLEARALAYLGPPASASDTARGIWGFVRVLRLNRCSLALLLFGVVQSRLRARTPSLGVSTIAHICDVTERPTISGPAFEDAAYWTRLEMFQVEVGRRAFDAVREILGLLQDNISSGISLGVMTGAQTILSRLPFWLQIILDTPTSEEGGPFGFTFHEKLRDLGGAVRALHSIGWSFERLARPAPWIQHEIHQLEERAKVFGSTQEHDWSLAGSGGGPAGFSDEEITALLASMTEGVFDVAGTSMSVLPGGRESAIQATPGTSGSAEENPVVAMLAGFFN